MKIFILFALVIGLDCVSVPIVSKEERRAIVRDSANTSN